MGLFRDLKDRRFGKLKVKRFVGMNRWGQAVWLCVCDCGNKREVPGTYLLVGSASHCVACNKRLKGKRSSNWKHGGSSRNKREHNSWAAARYRCNCPTSEAYHYYGGRGIRICDGWNNPLTGFINFLADMGRRPQNKSLDRIDVNGHYSCGHCAECVANSWPKNCRWATQEVQVANRRPITPEEYRQLEADIQAEHDELHPY